MSTVRSPVSTRPFPPFPPAVAVWDAHLDTVLLTVAAHPLKPRTVVVAVDGEVDLLTNPLLRHGLLAHLRHSARLLVVDLTEVVFFGAAGLTTLITAREAAVAAGIDFRVVACTRPVLLPLRITGLDSVFDIFPTRAHALNRMVAAGTTGTMPIPPACIMA